VAVFAAPLLERHDRSRFEVTAYCNAFAEDESRSAFEPAWHFTVVAGLTDEEFVQRVRPDGIDVLVDLSGTRPAPSSCFRTPRGAGPGYVAGLCQYDRPCAMDFRITDARTDPPG